MHPAERPLSSEPLRFDIESGTDFFSRITNDIRHTRPGDRIALVTMSLEPQEPRVNELLVALHGAAGRGVRIHFATDAYALLVDNTSGSIGPMLLPNPLKQGAFSRRKQALELLGNHQSATVSVLNQPEHLLRNPFAGRSHIKAAVVNDHVYDIGPNLHQTDRSDMALHFESEPVANRLYDFLTQLVTTGNTQKTLEDVDQVWQLDADTQLYLDSGKRNQSVILDTFVDMVTAAQREVVGTFQYFPRGVVAKTLAQTALRSVSVHAFYNHPAVQGSLGKYPEMLISRLGQSRVPAYQLSDSIHLHSKGLATEQAGIIGSHNFDPRGVAFGTAEIAIMRQNAAFARQLADFLFAQAGVVPRRANRTDAQEQLALAA